MIFYGKHSNKRLMDEDQYEKLDISANIYRIFKEIVPHNLKGKERRKNRRKDRKQQSWQSNQNKDQDSHHDQEDILDHGAVYINQNPIHGVHVVKTQRIKEENHNENPTDHIDLKQNQNEHIYPERIVKSSDTQQQPAGVYIQS